jgi:cell volume regulation protein A
VVQGATFELLATRLGVTSSDEALAARPPPRPARSTAAISTTRPWSEADGDPAYPRQITGRAVVGQLRTRLDRPGALVELDDGRYAFTGPVLAIGSASALQAAARGRLERASGDAEREWWRDVIGALAR